ncbi:MAG: NUDIX domain-containing protein [Anaerolineae bacterium]
MSTYRYCPYCGTALITDLRRPACPECGFTYFRDPKVAVVAFVEQDARVLLVERGVAPFVGRWALPAGFLDYGEDPEAAVLREVYEETGLRVAVERLVEAAAPTEENGWVLLLIYIARVTGGQLRAGDDALDAAFYSAADLTRVTIAFESTKKLLALWQAGKLATPL